MAKNTTPIISGPRPMTYDHMKSTKKPPVRRVVIPMDDELAADWQDLEGRLQLAKMRLDLKIENEDIKAALLKEVADLTEKMDALRERMESNVAVFKFRGLGRKKYEKMQNEERYQPTEAQIELNKKRNGPGSSLPWNTDTFPPAIILASCVEPELTADQVKEMWNADEWTEAELLQLLGAALEVNQQVRNIDWGKG